MIRRAITFVIIGVVGVVLLFWGIQKWNYSRVHESTDNAQVDGHIVPVLAKVGGYVQQVTVNENQPVQAGQSLVQIDESEYRQRLAQAEAELQAAYASTGSNGTTGQAQAQVMTASGQHSALEAQITAARANSTAASRSAELVMMLT